MINFSFPLFEKMLVLKCLRFKTELFLLQETGYYILVLTVLNIAFSSLTRVESRLLFRQGQGFMEDHWRVLGRVTWQTHIPSNSNVCDTTMSGPPSVPCPGRDSGTVTTVKNGGRGEVTYRFCKRTPPRISKRWLKGL